jgi:hypothetical protein
MVFFSSYDRFSNLGRCFMCCSYNLEFGLIYGYSIYPQVGVTYHVFVCVVLSASYLGSISLLSTKAIHCLHLSAPLSLVFTRQLRPVW